MTTRRTHTQQQRNHCCLIKPPGHSGTDTHRDGHTPGRTHTWTDTHRHTPEQTHTWTDTHRSRQLRMGGFISQMFSRFSSRTPVRILMVGLDAAGKTTLLYRLKLAEVVSTIPTIGFNVETVDYKNISFTVWDVGGQTIIRPLWRHYYINTQGLIFVVDSSDSQRMKEAADELHRMLEEEELRGVALLVFANKQDLPRAMSVSDITEALSLSGVSQPWLVQPSCAVSGSGLVEGLDWLSNQILNQ